MEAFSSWVKKHFRQAMVTAFRLFFLICISFVILYPLLLKLSASFMTLDDVYNPMVRYFPRVFTLENYKRTIQLLRYPASLFNSIVLAGTTSFITVVFISLASYGFARFKFPFRNLLFGFVLFNIVVPPNVLLLPYFLRFSNFDYFGIISAVFGKAPNLSGSYLPFYILGATGTGLKNGLYIFLMRQYFRGLPKELEEAAYVDGAGMGRTLVSIIIPCAWPMMATVFLFSFVFMWTDMIYTPVFLQNRDVLPVNIGMLTHPGFGVEANVDTEALFSLLRNAGMVLLILPLIILYLFTQKFFVQSISRSGLTG